MKDMKEGLTSARKADTTHVRKAFMIYVARPCELGSVKYIRGNYLRKATPVEGSAPLAADFVRFRSYLRAARDHISDVLDAMENHLANDPDMLDEAGMRRAAYAVDTDVTPGAKVGASLLPHVAPACASLMMAVTQATNAGLLPEDPGQPWVNGVLDGWAGATLAAEPLPNISEDHEKKCPDGPHTHSWNAKLRSDQEERDLAGAGAYSNPNGDYR